MLCVTTPKPLNEQNSYLDALQLLDQARGSAREQLKAVLWCIRVELRIWMSAPEAQHDRSPLHRRGRFQYLR